MRESTDGAGDPRAHAEAGFDIGTDTITGTWDGTRPDLEYAVFCYMN